MNILLIPKIIELHKDQFEFSVERNLLSFKKMFSKIVKFMFHNFEFKRNMI